MAELAQTLDMSILYTDVEDDLEATLKRSSASTFEANETVVKKEEPEKPRVSEPAVKEADSTTSNKRPVKKAEEDGGSVATLEGG